MTSSDSQLLSLRDAMCAIGLDYAASILDTATQKAIARNETAVSLVDYPDESDPGPYPVPDNAPIEGWPVDDTRTLANSQLEAHWTPQMVEAAMVVGERYPDVAAEIYVVATL